MKTFNANELAKSNRLIILGKVGSGKTFHLLKIIGELKVKRHILIYADNDGDFENYKSLQNHNIELFNNDNFQQFIYKSKTYQTNNDPVTIIVDGLHEIESLDIKLLLQSKNSNIQVIVTTQKLNENQYFNLDCTTVDLN